MAGNYRARVKKGDLEVEVESTDKSYVDSRLKELLSEVQAVSAHNTPPSPRKPPGRVKKQKKIQIKNPSKQDEEVVGLDLPGIVAHLKDSDDYVQIEAKILDKRDILNRIMMCMHYAAEFSGDPFLTTGQVEAITNQLGVKVAMANAANKIRNNQKYFTGKTVRKKGQTVPYKLNRQGKNAFKGILKGKSE